MGKTRSDTKPPEDEEALSVLADAIIAKIVLLEAEIASALDREEKPCASSSKSRKKPRQ